MAIVGFLGLGVMGFPMAGHLHKAGHTVTVYNRTASKSKKWVNEYGGTSAKTPGQAAQGADFVMACVGNDNDLQTICTGPDGAFATMHNGAIFVDHTTVSAKITRELYERAATTGIGLSMHLCLVVKLERKMANLGLCVVVICFFIRR